MSTLQIPHSDTMASSASESPAPSPRLSPDATLVDINAICAAAKLQEEQSSGSSEAAEPATHEGCEIKLSQRKKWSLLAVFSLAMFVDSRSPLLKRCAAVADMRQSGRTLPSSSSQRLFRPTSMCPSSSNHGSSPPTL